MPKKKTVKKVEVKEEVKETPKVEVKEKPVKKEEVVRITFKGGFREFSEKVDGVDFKEKSNAFVKSLR